MTTTTTTTTAAKQSETKMNIHIQIRGVAQQDLEESLKDSELMQRALLQSLYEMTQTRLDGNELVKVQSERDTQKFYIQISIAGFQQQTIDEESVFDRA